MEYIGMHDDLILNGETTYPKCGAIITSDKCDKYDTEKWGVNMNKGYLWALAIKNSICIICWTVLAIEYYKSCYVPLK